MHRNKHCVRWNGYYPEMYLCQVFEIRPTTKTDYDDLRRLSQKADKRLGDVLAQIFQFPKDWQGRRSLDRT